MLTYLIRVSGITLVYMQVNVNELNALPKEYVVDGSTVIIMILCLVIAMFLKNKTSQEINL